MKFSTETIERSKQAARDIADWLCQMQSPMIDSDGNAGRVALLVSERNFVYYGAQWNVAFAVMGWLSAYKAFNNERYLQCAHGGANFIRSLQVFNPFIQQHRGAIRENSPQTRWCYPRDALSAAWAMLEMYRQTNVQEWLDRAVMFAQWFVKEALDEEGWPYWGVVLEEMNTNEKPPQICNDIQGSFHGGGLNFFYQLAKVTGDDKWVGDFYIKMADHLVERIQQSDGYFRSIERRTHTPPTQDPQMGLHRANDDLGSLGLLGAYKVTGDEKYLRAIERFLQAVFHNQNDKGMFEESVACIPVLLNIVHESKGLVNCPAVTDDSCELALKALLSAQEKRARNPMTYGGIHEEPDDADGWICVRSGCYALIVLSKLLGGVKGYLTV